MYTSTYTNTCMHMYTNTYTNTGMHMYTNTYTNTCMHIFMGGSTVRLNKLQRLQNRALKICLGKSKLFPTQELQVKSLTNRQQDHLRLYAYNKSRTEKHRRSQTRCTRSNDGPLLAMVKSKCSVANMSANTWNKLPVSTRNAKNIAVFKRLLKK